MIISLRGPVWVYILDAAIQFVGAIIALLVAGYGYKAYKLTARNRYLYFSLAFILLGIGLLIFALVIPALFYYYKFYPNVYAGGLLYVSRTLNFIYMFAILMAYTLFVFIYSRIERKSIMALLAALVLSLVVYSFVYISFIGFNLISGMLLVFVIFYTSKNWLRRRNFNSLLVVLTFCLIAVSHALFIVGGFKNIFYFFAHGAQLIGYFSLFILFLRVHYGRKKK